MDHNLISTLPVSPPAALSMDAPAANKASTIKRWSPEVSTAAPADAAPVVAAPAVVAYPACLSSRCTAPHPRAEL